MNKIKNSKQFILPVSCANDFLDGFDYFIVEISPEYARLLLNRVKMLGTVRKRDKEAYELYFWDYAGAYFGGDPDEHDAARESSRVECNQLIVRDDEVNWIAVPKHTDIYATTDPIRVDQLAEIAARLR